MSRQRASDWIPTYNNLARSRGIAEIPVTAKMTLDEIANKIEWVNKLPRINLVRKGSKGRQKRRVVEHDSIIIGAVTELFHWVKQKSLQN